jgi:glycosyltransferase involved in cell wall biosynthesis
MALPWCRILVVEPGPGLWGAQRYVLNLVDLMAERGVEQVLAAPAESDLARAWRAAGHRTVVFDPAAQRSIRRPSGALAPALALREVGRTLANARRIAALAREVSADVIQANTHWTHLEAVTASRLAGRPAVLHLLDQSRRDALGRLRAVAVNRAAGTIGCSQAVIDTLPPGTAAKVVKVPIGVDTSVFAPGPADPGLRAELTRYPAAPVVLVVARIVPGKGIDDAIRAVHGLPATLGPVTLAVAGASTDPQFDAQIRAVGRDLLDDRLVLLGARSDVSALLRTADVLLLASEAEGMPLSVLEAQATGLPVVAYPAGGGATELVEHGRTGLLARQGDVADLTAQLEHLLGEPALAERLSAAARERILAEGTLAHQADRLAALLNGLDRGAAPAPTSAR